FYHIGAATCAISNKHPNTAAWFVKHNGKEIEIETTECTESYKCEISANVFKRACGSENGCHDLWDKGEGFRCPVESNLRVKQENGSIINGTMEHLVCKEDTGHWTIERKERSGDR
ncbi:hypothetical protein PMAYCL1PPCAC_00986, partial [Pristionchus mayeri]